MNNTSESAPQLSPSITLRRGNVEIKVQNAAAITQKINEKYPAYRQSYDTWRKNKRIDEQIKWQMAARDWFKNEMFGGLGDFEVIVSEPEKAFKSTIEDGAVTWFNGIDPRNQPTGYGTLPEFQNIQPLQEQIVQSVNKNAYEIRLDILKEAIAWSSRPGLNSTDDDVINLAKKFYSFVENRR